MLGITLLSISFNDAFSVFVSFLRVSTSLYFQKKGERKRLSKLESLDVIGYFSGFSIGTSLETSLGDAVSAFGFFRQEKSRARMT